MGYDKTENLPDPTSLHAVDDLSLSIRQSGASGYSGVTQGGFSSGANVTSSPFVSPPAVCPLPGNVDEMNLNPLHHRHLEPNLMNVRNISPSFSSESERPHCMENSAEINHPNMNNNTLTSDSLINEGVLSRGIQNPGASMNFMPMHSSGATGSNIEDRSSHRFSGKEVSSRLEEAVLPQTNSSSVPQIRRNFPSLIHGVPGGIANFQHDSGGLPNSSRNLGVLAPGSRISVPPFMYVTPDARLNSSNTRNLGAVGKGDVRFSEPDPLKYAQGGLPPPPLPFSSNSTLHPHLGFGRMPAAAESAQLVRVAAQPTIRQQSNPYTNISRNQYFMGSPILGHGGGRVRQDHSGQQSFVNVPRPWANNLFPEGMRAQNAGWSGIQPAPGNQFPKRLGVQLNDGAISQATQEGVIAGTGGIQQIRTGNSYQSQDHGPNMNPAELLQPPLAMGRPQGGSPSNYNVSGLLYHAGRLQGGSPANYNVNGLPYHAGHGVPISKIDVTPQASYIHGRTSLKRRASGAPPTAPMLQRRRTLAQHSNQQLIAHQRPITNAPVPVSSPSVPSRRAKGQGLEEPGQPVGEKCRLCKRDVAFNPEGPFTRPAIPPAVAVLPCGHVFHDHCLQIITPPDQSKDPPCIPCALGET